MDLLEIIGQEIFETYNEYVRKNYREPVINISFSCYGYTLAKSSNAFAKVSCLQEYDTGTIYGINFFVSRDQEQNYIISVS